MKDLLLCVHVVVETFSLEMSRCHLADFVRALCKSACRTCSTIIFAHSTNQIIVFWRPCCRCRGPCLSSLLSSKRRTNLLMLSSSAESGRKLKSNEIMCKETPISFRSVGKISPNSWIYRSLKPKCSMSSKYQKGSYRPYAARFRFLSLHRRVNHAAKEKQKGTN